MALFRWLFRRGRNDASATTQAGNIRVDHENGHSPLNDQVARIMRLRRRYEDIIRSLCYGKVSGKSNVPHFPEAYSNYAVGDLVAAYAQDKLPELAIPFSRSTELNEHDVEKALVRLERAESSLDIHPDFAKYVTKLD